MIGKDRVRIHPYLPRALRAQLLQHCASVNATEASVVEAAIRKYIDGTGDKTLLFRRLDRLGRSIQRLERDLDLHMEAFAIWVKLWFAHTPSVPEDAKRSARQLAESRYRQFVEHVAEQFNAGRRFMQDLPHESIADDAELAEVAADTEAESEDLE